MLARNIHKALHDFTVLFAAPNAPHQLRICFALRNAQPYVILKAF